MRNELRAFGSYSSNKGRMLRVDVVLCSGEAYCLKENAAKEKIKGNDIALATNRISF